MKHLIVIISLFAATLLPAVAETPKRPALLLTINVQGLSTDYLNFLADEFLDGGFNRLRREGLTFDCVDYGSPIDPTAATAMVYTGAAPSVNGVGELSVWDKDKQAPFHVFFDASTLGNFTNETYSPKALLTSTLADEVRIDSRGNGIVESVAPSPAEALIMSGHAGNGAFWISDATGNWASSTYYTDMPNAVSQRNYRNPLSQRLDTIVWEPFYGTALLPGISEQKKMHPFRHTFPKNDPDRYIAFKHSARGNTEVTDLAMELLNTLDMGRHNGMDMLNVAYSVAPYYFGRSTDCAVETIDAYIRLDRDIARLLKAAEAKAAPGQVAVMVVGVPAPANDKRDAELWRVPFGQFSVRKATSLLNMYLMAKYGNGNWITGYHNRQFFINKPLLKEKSLDESDLRSECAEFLMRMSGVAEAFTIDDVIASRVDGDAAALKRNTIVKNAGDIFVVVSPGWEIVDENNVTAKASHGVVERRHRSANAAFLRAPGLKPGRVERPVDARILVPTLARAIWLRTPNGASLAPLP